MCCDSLTVRKPAQEKSAWCRPCITLDVASRIMLDFCTLVSISEQNYIGLSVLELLHVIKLLSRNLDTWFTLEYRVHFLIQLVDFFISFLSFYSAFTRANITNCAFPWIHDIFKNIYIKMNNINRIPDTFASVRLYFRRKPICIIPGLNWDCIVPKNEMLTHVFPTAWKQAC